MAPECLKCVEMIIFWISGVNRVTLLLRLISSVSFDFFFNVATRNFLTSMCGSHFVFTGESWPRRSQAHRYAPLHLCFTKGPERGCGKQGGCGQLAPHQPGKANVPSLLREGMSHHQHFPKSISQDINSKTKHSVSKIQVRVCLAFYASSNVFFKYLLKLFQVCLNFLINEMKVIAPTICGCCDE